MEEISYLHLLDLVRNCFAQFLIQSLSLLGFLGPVTNISSAVKNCSTIGVLWTAPTVDDRISIQYYILKVYDTINSSLVDTVSVYDTTYQFVDHNLFFHCYTYVITGVNELGEGMPNNDTFSYQRGKRHNRQQLLILCLFLVPRSVSGTGSSLITFNQTTATASYNIPVIPYHVINVYIIII